MARLKLNFVLSDLRDRVGNVVFSKWKGVNYLKEYTPHPVSNSPGQMQVRSNFSRLVAAWRPLAPALRRTWDAAAHGLDMTGYNLFIGENSKHLDKGEPIEISRASRGEPLTGFTVTPRTPGEGLQVAFAYPASATGLHLLLGVQKVDSNNALSPVAFTDHGADAVSPITVSSLEAGATYVVYGYLANGDLATATSLSPAVSGSAAPGA